MTIYTVEHVTNVTTGASYDAGQVHAESHDQAYERAVAGGLIPEFQTFRIRREEDVPGESVDISRCECWFSCADDPDHACSHSGEWHTHDDAPCPIHPDALMVG